MEREIEERFERLEAQADRAWRAIELLAKDQAEHARRAEAEYAKTQEQFRRTEEQVRRTDERIEKLVIAIGEFISGSHS
jgi:seryl-tRNA synthetase